MIASNQQHAKVPAVVIGLDCITGLQTARILAAHGVPVIGIAKSGDHYCCRTRVCEQIHVADTGSEAFIELLEQLGSQFDEQPVLYPCSDMSVLLCSRNRERLAPWYRLALPDADTVEMLMDKISFLTYAQEHGLPVPGTAFLRDRADVERAAETLSFPCILKPPMKTPRWEQQTKAKVFKVDSPQELLALYDRCCDWADLLMVQEWVEGTDANLYSCNCYFDANSQPVVTFVARKLRQWPPETGTSCLGEECRNDEVLEETVRLFRQVRYCGLGYLEMKRDARTGRHYIIEPNVGRPTGRSAIAEAGGVELLYSMYADLTGRPLPAAREQAYGGAKWIYWRRDFQSAWYYWRRGRLTLADWCRSWRGSKGYAVFDWHDQGPFWADLRKSLRMALSLPKRKPTNQAAPQQRSPDTSSTTEPLLRESTA